MPTNYTLPSNITGLGDLGVYVGSATYGVWGWMPLMVIYFISVGAAIRVFGIDSFSRANIVGCGVLAFASVLWRFAGQCSDYVMIGALIFSLIGVLVSYFGDID
jgi:hypothetical protein